MTSPYAPLRPAKSHFLPLRGLSYHVNQWGDASLVTPTRPPLLLLHGWMDVGASFQFLVDALARSDGFERWVLAPDWRGFGLTDAPGVDTFWFPDYLGDLDALMDAALNAAPPCQTVDLLGHSMGGNVAMSYGGVRPTRVRRLVNLEGFGLPQTQPSQAPQRMRQWLDELKQPLALRDYASVDEVAARLQRNNPRLSADKAAWLAPHWARHLPDGRWRILGHPAHKRVNPALYQVDQTLATWAGITAPLLWAEGDETDLTPWWGTSYSKAEFHERLKTVPDVQKLQLSACGHMLHHDQPDALARHLSAFLGP